MKRQFPFPGRICILLLLLISLLAGGLIAYATRNGPWGFSDPVAYIVSGRNLARGIGIGYHFPDGRFHWLAFHPPFYPMVSSIFTLLGIDEIGCIRWLNIALFAVSVFVCGYSIYRFCALPELAVPASMFTAVFPPLVRMYSSAMSEPLFMSLWFISALFLLTYLRHGKPKFFLLSAFTAGLALLTRYIGAALIAASALSLLILDKNRISSRLKEAVGYGLIASLPTTTWLIWIYLQSGHSIGGRQANLELPALLNKFQQFRGALMDNFVNFMPLSAHLPYRWRWISIGGAAIGILLVTIFALYRLNFRKMDIGEYSNLDIFTLYGLSAVLSIGFLGATYLPTQPPPDIDERTLLPFFPSLALALIGAFSIWSKAWFHGRRRWLNGIAWLAVALLVLASWPRSLNRIKAYHDGVGITSNRWRTSETIQAVKALPAEMPLISNEAPAILLWADRPAYDLRETLRVEFIQQTDSYGSDSEDASQRVFQSGGALIIFHSLPSQLQEAYGEAGRMRLDSMLSGLSVYGIYEDGAIYFASPQAFP